MLGFFPSLAQKRLSIPSTPFLFSRDQQQSNRVILVRDVHSPELVVETNRRVT